MNYFYSPNTGEHIDTDSPAPWMLPALVAPPPYDKATASAFWRVGVWEVVPAKEAGIETASAWEQIKLYRDYLTQNGGYKVVVGGVDKWFHSDVFSRVRQVGLVMLGADIPPTLQWKTMDGSFVTMTPALAQQIFQAAAAKEIAHFAKAEEHHAALQALTTVEEIAAYDWKAGWPEVWVPTTQP